MWVLYIPDTRLLAPRFNTTTYMSIAGPGMNPPHVDTILVKNYYEFFSENLGIDSTRDRYRESFLSPFATIREKKVFKKKVQVVRRNGEIWVCEMLTYTHLQGDVAT